MGWRNKLAKKAHHNDRNRRREERRDLKRELIRRWVP